MLRVIFYQWPKLGLGLDVQAEIKILKVIYSRGPHTKGICAGKAQGPFLKLGYRGKFAFITFENSQISF